MCGEEIAGRLGAGAEGGGGGGSGGSVGAAGGGGGGEGAGGGGVADSPVLPVTAMGETILESRFGVCPGCKSEESDFIGVAAVVAVGVGVGGVVG